MCWRAGRQPVAICHQKDQQMWSSNLWRFSWKMPSWLNQCLMVVHTNSLSSGWLLQLVCVVVIWFYAAPRRKRPRRLWAMLLPLHSYFKHAMKITTKVNQIRLVARIVGPNWKWKYPEMYRIPKCCRSGPTVPRCYVIDKIAHPEIIREIEISQMGYGLVAFPYRFEIMEPIYTISRTDNHSCFPEGLCCFYFHVIYFYDKHNFDYIPLQNGQWLRTLLTNSRSTNIRFNWEIRVHHVVFSFHFDYW